MISSPLPYDLADTYKRLLNRLYPTLDNIGLTDDKLDIAYNMIEESTLKYGTAIYFSAVCCSMNALICGLGYYLDDRFLKPLKIVLDHDLIFRYLLDGMKQTSFATAKQDLIEIILDYLKTDNMAEILGKLVIFESKHEDKILSSRFITVASQIMEGGTSKCSNQ